MGLGYKRLDLALALTPKLHFLWLPALVKAETVSYWTWRNTYAVPDGACMSPTFRKRPVCAGCKAGLTCPGRNRKGRGGVSSGQEPQPGQRSRKSREQSTHRRAQIERNCSSQNPRSEIGIQSPSYPFPPKVPFTSNTGQRVDGAGPPAHRWRCQHSTVRAALRLAWHSRTKAGAGSEPGHLN